MLPNSVEVLDNLTERIQIETMKTYVFTYRRFYEKISIKKFSELFSLPEDKIVTTMEKVIADLELNIKLDDNKTYIVIEKGDEVSKLEEVAVKLNKEIRATRERLNSISSQSSLRIGKNIATFKQFININCYEAVFS